MLDPLSVWVAQLEAMGGSQSIHEGDVKISTVIGNLINKVQANPNGSVGILTFNIPAMWAYLDSQWEPTAASQDWQQWNNTNWALILSTGWFKGMTQGAITPNTDTDSTWDCSGDRDTLTNSAPATTLPNLTALFNQLHSDLLAIAGGFLPSDGPSQEFADDALTQLATAFRNAIANATFICIGLKHAGPICIQVPLTRTAV